MKTSYRRSWLTGSLWRIYYNLTKWAEIGFGQILQCSFSTKWLGQQYDTRKKRSTCDRCWQRVGEGSIKMWQRSKGESLGWWRVTRGDGRWTKLVDCPFQRTCVRNVREYAAVLVICRQRWSPGWWRVTEVKRKKKRSTYDRCGQGGQRVLA